MCELALKRLKTFIRKDRPSLLTTGILLLHDNAKPHSATATMHLLKSWGEEILPHPQYNPFLAPLEFRLFSKMKMRLIGQPIHSRENVQNEVKKWLRAQRPIFFQ
jgi:hypothetical protein